MDDFDERVENYLRNNVFLSVSVNCNSDRVTVKVRLQGHDGRTLAESQDSDTVVIYQSDVRA